MNGTINGNAEVIKGIKNISDPENYFAALVRINNELNDNWGRFTITSDGKLKINDLHIIDPREFSTLTLAEKSEILSAPPAPQTTISRTDFDLKKNDIYNTFVGFTRKHDVALGKVGFDIVTAIIKSGPDLASITLILNEYTKSAIEKILNILVEVLRVATNFIELKLRELFPFVSLPIGVLQFIVQLLREMSENLGLKSVTNTLDLFFDRDGLIAPALVEDVRDKLFSWVQTKLNLMRCIAEDPVNRTKEKKDCPLCKGCFFVNV